MSALPKPRKQPEIAFFLFARPHSYSQTHEMDKTRTLLQKTLEYETAIKVYIPNNLAIIWLKRILQFLKYRCDIRS